MIALLVYTSRLTLWHPCIQTQRAREEEEAGGSGAEGPSSHGLRQYGQRVPKADPVLETGVVPLSDSLLSKIAGRRKASVQ